MKKSVFLYACFLLVFSALLSPVSLSAQLVLTPLKDGQVIGLRTATKRYAGVRSGVSGDVVRSYNSLFGSEEKYTVSLQPNNKIALKAHTGKWWCADLSQNAPHDAIIFASRSAIGPWERFEVIDHGNNVISLKAEANGKYVQEDQNFTNRLQANTTTIGDWARFEVVSDPIPAAVEFEQLITAIEKYAPKVYFQSGEAYLPCSIEDFIAATVPANDHEGKPGLKISNQTIKYGKLANAKAYVNLIIGSTYTDIQYWFLYGYNGAGTAYLKRFEPISWPPWESGRYHSMGDHSMSPAGQHEGDWEHITVRIRNDNYEAQKVHLASHGSGSTRSYAQTLRDGMVTFYSSKNGHAAYASAERHYPEFKSIGIIEFRLLDNTDSPSQSFTSRGNWVIIGAHEGAKDILAESGVTFDWMKYTGRWGLCVSGKISMPSGPYGIFSAIIKLTGLSSALAEFDVERGPAPPWAKASWTTAESF